MTTREFQDRLSRRARRAGVAISSGLGLQLETYYRLLAAWNRKINLAGMELTEGSPEALDRLLIEPLMAARHCPSGVRRMIDIGSGGGSPAIPFALALSGMSLRLVESKVRKSVFLREALRALEMTSAEVEVARFEALLMRPDLREAHDLLTIRAVKIDPRILMSLQAFVRPNGFLFLFRASPVGQPSERLTLPLAWGATYPLIEPLRSCLVVLKKREAHA